jgi:hypothetical protein
MGLYTDSLSPPLFNRSSSPFFFLFNLPFLARTISTTAVATIAPPTPPTTPPMIASFATAPG